MKLGMILVADTINQVNKNKERKNLGTRFRG